MQVVYFLLPAGVVATRKYSDSICKSILRYSLNVYNAICTPYKIEAGSAVAIKEQLEYELPVLKQFVDPDDTQLVSLVEDYISLCNVYPDAVVISENDGV